MASAASRVLMQGALSASSGMKSLTGLMGRTLGSVAKYGTAGAVGAAVAGGGSEQPKTPTSSMGMAGSAGRQAVGGGRAGTTTSAMPNFTRVASTSVSSADSMQRILLQAVRHLASIEATLKTQTDQQRFVARQAGIEARENAIEARSGGSSIIGSVVGSSPVQAVLSPFENLAKGLLASLVVGLVGNLDSAKKTAETLGAIAIGAAAAKLGYSGLRTGIPMAFAMRKATIQGNAAAAAAARNAAAQSAAQRTAANQQRAGMYKPVLNGQITETGRYAQYLQDKYGIGKAEAVKRAQRIQASAGLSQGNVTEGLRRISEVEAEVKAVKKDVSGIKSGKVKLPLGAGIGKGLGGALKGAGGAIKGNLAIGLILEGAMYAFGGKEMNAKNLVGSLGAILGGALGAFGGSLLGPVGTVAGGIGGAYFGEQIANSLYNFFAGDSPTGQSDKPTKGSLTRAGKTAPSRNYNPGSIMAGAYKIGTPDQPGDLGNIGTEKLGTGMTMLKFPSEAAGFAALDKYLETDKNVSTLSLGDALQIHLAGKGAYGSKSSLDRMNTVKSMVENQTGEQLDLSYSYSDLSADVQDHVMKAIATLEGYYAAGAGFRMKPGDVMPEGTGYKESMLTQTMRDILTAGAGGKSAGTTDTGPSAVPSGSMAAQAATQIATNAIAMEKLATTGAMGKNISSQAASNSQAARVAQMASGHGNGVMSVPDPKFYNAGQTRNLYA
jgi:hypothetical protein